jgi:hypothetical protein
LIEERDALSDLLRDVGGGAVILDAKNTAEIHPVQFVQDAADVRLARAKGDALSLLVDILEMERAVLKWKPLL